MENINCCKDTALDDYWPKCGCEACRKADKKELEKLKSIYIDRNKSREDRIAAVRVIVKKRLYKSIGYPSMEDYCNDALGVTVSCVYMQMRGYKPEHVPVHIQWEVWERDNFTCQECFVRRDLVIECISPQPVDGKWNTSELRTLCKECKRDAKLRK